MNVTLSARKCAFGDCQKPAVLTEQYCDEHLIAEWVRLYQSTKSSLQPCGHGIEFVHRDFLTGGMFCTLCAAERRSNGV